MTTLRSAERPRPLQQLAAGVTIGVAVAVGLGMIFLAMVVGSCDAFGGTCPAERPSLLEDDVFGMAAFGAVLVVAVPISSVTRRSDASSLRSGSDSWPPSSWA